MSEKATYTEHVYKEYSHGIFSDPLTRREEIVRCKDCEHMREVTMPSMLFADETFTSYRCGADQWSTASLMPMHSVEPEGFCAWGVRKMEK